MDYAHARRGSGSTVHAIGGGGQLCGAGKNSIGTQWVYRLRYTTDPITCKACLRKMAARLAARQGDEPSPKEWAAMRAAVEATRPRGDD